MMMVVVTMRVMIVVVICLTPSARGGAGLGTLDGGRTHKGVGAEDQAAANGLAGLGVFRERRILDRLAKLETPHLLSGPRQGFVDVGDHTEMGLPPTVWV